ncbi:Rpn family recombination-promoting nuclease/putative transposase [Rickettsia oklahomensis]|uniref:Rpn family recombination-promoting nuclease/putative transposase n=1 Tax=Rickettsia oklahomensis TaxID=3141789 RepID=A0AAU7BYB4_9RICK
MKNSIVAKEFFEMYLPPHIKALFSIEILKMEKDSFIGPNLKKFILDILLLNLMVKSAIYFYCYDIKVNP